MGQFVAGNVKTGNPIEDGQEGFLAEPAQLVGCSLSEEDEGGFHSHFILFAAVDHDGDLFGQSFLEKPLMRRLPVFAGQLIDLLPVEKGEDFDVFLSIFVGGV